MPPQNDDLTPTTPQTEPTQSWDTPAPQEPTPAQPALFRPDVVSDPAPSESTVFQPSPEADPAAAPIADVQPSVTPETAAPQVFSSAPEEVTPVATPVVSDVGQAANPVAPILATTITPPQPSGTMDPTSGTFVSVHDESPSNGKAFKPKNGNKRRLPAKLLLIVLACLIVFGGGGAAAYYGYVIPHQPGNILKTAVLNSLQQKQMSFTGTLNADPTTTGGTAVKASFSGEENIATKASDIQITLTIAGVSFSVEARLLDQNIYIKLGDLSTIETLLQAELGASGSAETQAIGSALTAVGSDLSNQWIELDSTLLKQAGATCVLDSNLEITQADITALESAYKQHEFVAINSTSSATVNGQASEKFNVTLNDDKASSFVNSLSNLPTLKAIDSCSATTKSEESSATNSFADGQSTPISLWVNKKTNQIDQFSASTTPMDQKKDHVEGSVTVTLSYGPVSITAPAGAKSFTDVLAQIEQTIASNPNTAGLLDLLGGSSSTSSQSDSTLSQAL